MSVPLRIVCVGAGPAGLYFALLMKRADSRHDIHVIERNRADDTFGFGVVFSDATMAAVSQADPEAFRAIAGHLVHWDDIAVYYPPRRDGDVPGDPSCEPIVSTGHGFSGMSRHTLLRVLQEQARDAGVGLTFEHEVTDLRALEGADLVVGADGVNSTVRRLLGDRVETEIDRRPNRFVWLGTTKPFPAFTFYFREDAHGLWRVHAYQYAPGHSTFIVECRDETWRAAGLDTMSEGESTRFLEHLFAQELAGHRLIANRSVWRQFPTLRVSPWSSGNIVLLGDAAHTAHFSVGSGTRLAMEDAAALRDAVVSSLAALEPGASSVAPALARACEGYERTRRPQVESLQRAAQASLQWFEDAERYVRLHPLQFVFALLTRSLRITHEDLRKRDPAFSMKVDAWHADAARRAVAGVSTAADDTDENGAADDAERSRAADDADGNVDAAEGKGSVEGQRRWPPPPMFTPFRLRDLVLTNRVAVSAMCQYMATDGLVGDWHLVHLGSRAMGGAGLVMAEMTDVSAEARISVGCAGLYCEEHAAAWRRIVEFVHRETPAKIGVQLGHAGRKAATRKLWEGDSEPLESGAWPIVSASPVPYFPDRSQTPREMTRADMDVVLDAFVRATRLAFEAGFDLLELHMAHGYLLASFISPLTNRRQDEYGGALENRMRFPLEVFDACRAAWPDERPMSVRISAVDWAPGGMDPTEAVAVARLLRAHGCDIVDVSAGQTVPDQRPVYGRLFQTPFADRIRHEVGIATMAVGNISSYMDVNTIVAAGRADLCLLARAHLFDPYWTRHAAYMQGYELPWPNPYKSVERYTPRFGFEY